MNFFEVSGVPSEFGILLLTLSLILFLSPYFSGVDFGVINIPKLKANAQKRLKIVGPFIVLIFLLLFFPLWSQFFRVTLSPILNSSTSPLLGQSIRIGVSQTSYRIEIIVKNVSMREDRLINHVDISASDSICGGAQPLPATSFTISDSLLVQPTHENNRLNIQGEVAQDQDTDFVYKVEGEYRIMNCNESTSHTLQLGFDSSIVITKNSSVQFDVLLPRDLKVIDEFTSENANSMNIDSLLANTKDVLKSLPFVDIDIWDSEAEKPIRFSTDR